MKGLHQECVNNSPDEQKRKQMMEARTHTHRSRHSHKDPVTPASVGPEVGPLRPQELHSSHHHEQQQDQPSRDSASFWGKWSLTHAGGHTGSAATGGAPGSVSGCPVYTRRCTQLWHCQAYPRGKCLSTQTLRHDAHSSSVCDGPISKQASVQPQAPGLVS